MRHLQMASIDKATGKSHNHEQGMEKLKKARRNMSKWKSEMIKKTFWLEIIRILKKIKEL